MRGHAGGGGGAATSDGGRAASAPPSTAVGKVAIETAREEGRVEARVEAREVARSALVDAQREVAMLTRGLGCAALRNVLAAERCSDACALASAMQAWRQLDRRAR